MNTTNRPRRVFILGAIATGTALASVRVFAQAAVKDTDPQALALGYVSEATKADTKKYPKYAAGQACSSCALYQGKAGEAAGNCPLFAGKQVAAKGWCSAWAMKG